MLGDARNSNKVVNVYIYLLISDETVGRGGVNRYNFIHGLSISMRGSVGFTRRAPDLRRKPVSRL